MVKVGNFYYDGNSFIKVIDDMDHVNEVEINVIASKKLWFKNLDNSTTMMLKAFNEFKDLGSNEEVIQELYPDYYRLAYDLNTVYVTQGNQFGKTTGNIYTIIKNFYL